MELAAGLKSKKYLELAPNAVRIQLEHSRNSGGTL